MARRAILWAIALASMVLPAAGQPDSDIEAELEALCKTVLCRPPAAIRLKLPAGEFFEMTPTSPTPIVSGALVTVYPGETIRVEAKVEANQLVGLTAVQEIAHPDRTLTFHLKQAPEIGDGTDMLLKVESSFPGVIKYRMGMMLPTGEGVFKTSTCPLHQGSPVVEHWPHPVFQLVATDFRLVDPESKEATTCE